MRNATAMLAAVLVGATACRTESPPMSGDTSAATSIGATPSPDSASGASSVSAWAMTPNGIGPLRAGMTVAEATAALNGNFPGADAGAGCHEVAIPGAPARVTAMIVDGVIGRFDTKDAGIVSNLGARVGDTQAHVESLYVGRVVTQPHKYVATGRYLIVTPTAPADSAYRLIFETDGAKVLEFRGGLTPIASQVEHCS